MSMKKLFAVPLYWNSGGLCHLLFPSDKYIIADICVENMAPF